MQRASSRGDERLCLRELQSQLFLEERSHCSFLLFSGVPSPSLLLGTRWNADEEEEVIRVPNGHDDREALASLGLPSIRGSELWGCRIASGGCDATWPNLPLVSLLDDAEGDVREQGRENPTLRRASIAANEVAFGLPVPYEKRAHPDVERGRFGSKINLADTSP